MSRAYKIRVCESLRRVIRAEDHVGSQVELLPILPADQMADLLARELSQRGFERTGNVMSRQSGEIVVTIELESGEVAVRADSERQIRLRSESATIVYDEQRESRSDVEIKLREQVLRQLESEAAREQTDLQQRLTDRLEAELGDLRVDLDQAVNRATAQALKQKAAQLGQIREVTEDAQSGELTIVVEV